MEHTPDLTPAIKHLSDALTEGASVGSGDYVAVLSLRWVGALTVLTGSIVVCDPLLVEFGFQAFGTRVPPGRYPVVLSIARFPTDTERVAYASLQLQEHQPTRWEIATFEGVDEIQDGKEAPGYSVETGTACFMDAAAAQVLQQRLHVDREYGMLIVDEMSKNAGEGRDWADLSIEPGTGANLIAFGSGAGDGTYTSYFGYDARDTIVCLTTDFELLWPLEEQTITSA